MLKIQRSMEGGRVRYSLSGRVEGEQLTELERLLAEEETGQRLVLDLEEVRLVDREAVGFLARCEKGGVRLENCPAYVREWIDTETGEPENPPPRTRR